MQAKLNWILLSIIIGLAGIAVAINKHKSKDHELRLPIKVNELTVIAIKHNQEIKLEKKNSYWTMTSPQQGRINQERMQKILTNLQLPIQGGFETSNQLTLYGLDKPRMQVKLNNNLLSFGQLNTMKQMHYIEYQGKIYLASPFLQTAFDHSAEALIMQENLKVN